MPKLLLETLTAQVAELERQYEATQASITALEAAYAPIEQRLRRLRHIQNYLDSTLREARRAVSAVESCQRPDDIPW